MRLPAPTSLPLVALTALGLLSLPVAFVADRGAGPGVDVASPERAPSPSAASFLHDDPSDPDYYGAVRPLLLQHCMGCHAEEGPGWSMVDPEETFARNRLIAAMVVQRQMPPWLAEPGHQEYVGDLSLPEEAVETVRRWRDAGFPRGTPVADEAHDAHDHGAAGGGHGGHGGPFVPEVSLEVLPGGRFLPNQNAPDDYRCFVVDWDGEEPMWMTGFRASPGNLAVAHHVVVHAVDAELAGRFHELADAEEGPGYRCFGGALPDRLGIRAEREAYEARYPGGVRELSAGNYWLAHWAPGMDGHVFPEGTGILLEPGAALVVQVHYYAADAPGQYDEGTRVEFQLAESVERPAFHFSQTRGDWLVSERNRSMVIEPGATATYEVRDVMENLVPYISRITRVPAERIGALEIHSANLHMHAFGHAGQISLTHPSGARETLLSVPRWDLRWQRDFTFAEPKVFPRNVLRGVALTTECTFRNPTEEVVYGGYGSYDEMCFNFSYIAVRVLPEE
jgi:hypothetical protein